METYSCWLVVLTILKNISQWEGLSRIISMEKMVQTTNQADLWYLSPTNKVMPLPAS